MKVSVTVLSLATLAVITSKKLVSAELYLMSCARAKAFAYVSGVCIIDNWKGQMYDYDSFALTNTFDTHHQNGYEATIAWIKTTEGFSSSKDQKWFFKTPTGYSEYFFPATDCSMKQDDNIGGETVAIAEYWTQDSTVEMLSWSRIDCLAFCLMRPSFLSGHISFPNITEVK